MKLVCYTFIVTLFSINSFSSEENQSISVESVIDSVVSNYKNYYSMSFDMIASKMFFFEPDTLLITYNCKYYRLNDENLSSCYIYNNISFGVEKYYDFNQIYIINHKYKTMKIISCNNEIERQENLETYFDFYNGEYVFENYFLNLENLVKIKNDSSKKASLIENNNEIFLRQEWIAENEEVKFDYWYEIIIDKNSYNIIRKIFHADYDEFTQHFIFDINNIKYNDFDTSIVSRRIDSLKRIYDVDIDSEIVTPKSDNATNPLLEVNTIAPYFSGKYYQKDTLVSLEDYKGKIILIDFWYMSCYPCIMAIPFLNKMYEIYKDKGFIVLGLNRYDSDKKDVLDRFIKKYDIKYPIVFTDEKEDIDSIYKVRGYPSLYLLDKDLKIILSKRGFSEESMDSLDMIIKKYLKIDE
jgi:thiol-disulfide isomerase/thioredoxin